MPRPHFPESYAPSMGRDEDRHAGPATHSMAMVSDGQARDGAGAMAGHGPEAGSQTDGPDLAPKMPPQHTMQLRLKASYDQLPEPDVPKFPRALRMGLLIVPPVAIWLAINWLIRATS